MVPGPISNPVCARHGHARCPLAEPRRRRANRVTNWPAHPPPIRQTKSRNLLVPNQPSANRPTPPHLPPTRTFYYFSLPVLEAHITLARAMTDPEPTTVSHRLDSGLAGDKGSTIVSHTAAPYTYTGAGSPSANMNQFAAVPRGAALETRHSAGDDAPRFRTITSGGNLTKRDDHAGTARAAWDSRPNTYSTSSAFDYRPPAENNYPSQLPNRHPLPLSRTNSQGTNTTNGADPVFTPPASGGRLSPGTGSAQGSSQGSQLHQLSQIAAAQARIPEDAADMGHGASKKRMADGVVKHTRDKSNVSPRQMLGHSRNTSTVSVASTAGSRIGEVRFQSGRTVVRCANSSPAVGRTESAPVVRHGQGQPWMAVALY